MEGRLLAVDVGEPVLDALGATGAELSRWERYYRPGRFATALPADGLWDRVCVRLPRGRRNLQATAHVLAAQLAPGGRIWLYGANDEGIRSAGKTLEELFERVETVDARKHGRVLQAEGRVGQVRPLDDFESLVEAEVGGRRFCFRTLPGVFADGRLDAGTRHLLEHLKVEPGARVLDLGCGGGAIGVFVGDSGRWVGLDVDTWALRCAEKSAPGGDLRLSHVGSAVRSGERFEHIVSNPPFHDGQATDFRVMDALIAGAPDWLRPGGRLTFVCPRTAAVRPRLEAVFTKVELLSDDRSTRVWEATR